jgi:hypothetical protein
LLDPDQVRRSRRFANARLFSKWYDESLSGKHVVVVVVSDAEPRKRHWVVTAYLIRKIPEGDVEWKRNYFSNMTARATFYTSTRDLPIRNKIPKSSGMK